MQELRALAPTAADDSAGFLGTGWAYPVRFAPQGRGVEMASGERDVRESLLILLSTTPGERVMQPTFGCALRTQVFETLDASRATEIHDLVARAVLHFEPRVELIDVIVTQPDPLEGRVLVDLSYRMRATNTRHNLVYPLYLNEASAAGFSA
jgi:phage baseplate assembly protein W